MSAATLSATNFLGGVGTPGQAGSPFPWSSFVLTPNLLTGRPTPFGTSSESNPFDLSFSGTHHKSFTVEDLDLGATTSDIQPLPRRKRAMSSPAMTPGGTGLLNGSFGEAVEKRQKLECDTASVATSSIFSGSRRDSDSTVSTVPTPVSSKDGQFVDAYTSDDAIDTKLTLQQPPSLLTSSLAPPASGGYQPFTFNPRGAGLSSFPPVFSSKDISVSGDSVVPAATAFPPAFPSAANSSTASKGKAVATKNQKRDRSVSVATDDDVADEEEKRKALLERNRIAACKSRRKKKERVGNLEQEAADYAGRNVVLQTTALALRQELLQLRHVLELHDTCSCEHVKGYRLREQNGGGIPAIEALAGRTFTTNYQNVPTMGSEDDCFTHMFRWDRDPVSGIQIMVPRDSTDDYASVPSSTITPTSRRGSLGQSPLASVSSMPLGPAIPLRSTRANTGKATRQNTFAALNGHIITASA